MTTTDRDSNGVLTTLPSGKLQISLGSLVNLNDIGQKLRIENTISLFALILSAGFLGMGTFLLWEVHNDWLPFYFFSAANVIMIVYAIGIGCWLTAENLQGGGAISARWVMRWIFVLTCLSFDAGGMYMCGKPWSDPLTTLAVSSCGGPIEIAFFAILMGNYANHCNADILHGEEVECKRKGTSRGLMALMLFANMVVLFWNTCRVVQTYQQGDIWPIWLSMACLALAGFVSILAIGIFNKVVKEQDDRGIAGGKYREKN